MLRFRCHKIFIRSDQLISHHQTTLIQVPITQELQQKFRQIDVNNSETLSSVEVAEAYKLFHFPPESAKMLIQACTDVGFLDIHSFAIFDSYVSNMWLAYSSVAQKDQKCINTQQVAKAIAQLKINMPLHVLAALTAKYDKDNNGIEFGEFLAIGAYLLVCQKLMDKFDTNKDGTLEIDFAAMVQLGLWFI